MSAAGWCALFLLALVLAALWAAVRDGRELERDALERWGINDDEDGQ